MSQPDKRPNLQAITPGRIRVIEEDGLRVCVRESVEQGPHGPRFVAELTVLGHAREVAVIESSSPDDLADLIPAAIQSFASSVRLRKLAAQR
jgi:hypothetical protein